MKGQEIVTRVTANARKEFAKYWSGPVPKNMDTYLGDMMRMATYHKRGKVDGIDQYVSVDRKWELFLAIKEIGERHYEIKIVAFHRISLGRRKLGYRRDKAKREALVAIRQAYAED